MRHGHENAVTAVRTAVNEGTRSLRGWRPRRRWRQKNAGVATRPEGQWHGAELRCQRLHELRRQHARVARSVRPSSAAGARPARRARAYMLNMQ